MAPYDNVARIMAGDKSPPDWLPKALSIYGEVLETARQNEAKRLGRKAMKKRLVDLRKATAIVMAALDDPHMFTMLSHHTPGQELNPDIWCGLSDVAAAAEGAELSLSTTTGPDRARVPAEVPPRVVCAMIVSIVMRYLGRRLPTGRAADDQNAAEALWRASGGPEFSGHARTNVISWEHAFRRMIKAKPEFQMALKSMLRNRQRVAIPRDDPLIATR
jgi:hypothetical protein